MLYNYIVRNTSNILDIVIVPCILMLVKTIIKKDKNFSQIIYKGIKNMRELPQHRFFEGFYIWFDKDKKEEYYGTSLYLHNVDTKIDYDKRQVKLILKKTKFDGLKYPGLLYFPYTESFGMMLMRFLNADFSSFEKSYKTFFYAYGFELLKEYIPYKELKETYKTEKKMLEVMKKVYEDSKYELYEMQENFRQCVNQVYNLNGEEGFEEASANLKFIANIIKHKSDVYRYSNKIEVILDSYSSKDDDYSSVSYENIVNKLEDGELSIKKHNVYTSERLSNILYVILEQIVQVPNLPIKQCQNCGKYFIPSSRQDEIYCEFPDEKGKTCKEKGAIQTYKKNLESIPALLEYRRSYQKKIMIVSRNKENKELKKEFDKWKKEAQEKIKLFKQGKLEEDVLYNWIIENK